MNPRFPLYLALAAALLLGKARAEDSQPAKATGAPAPNAADPKQSYDALFTDILKTLPQEKRALVDSAHGAKGKAVTPPARPADPEAAKKAAKEKRDKALQELPPEVKARVDKAIQDLDTRRMQREAELKELGK
jgi:hypothetical protein